MKTTLALLKLILMPIATLKGKLTSLLEAMN